MKNLYNNITKKIIFTVFCILTVLIVISADNYFSEAYRPDPSTMTGYFNIGEKLYSDGSGEFEYYLFVDRENGTRPYNVKFYNNENPFDFTGRFVSIQGEVRKANADLVDEKNRFIQSSDIIDVSTIKDSVSHREFNDNVDEAKKTSSMLRAVPSSLKTVVILAKYSGDISEPHSKSYFEARWFTASDSLKNYWVDTSYNAITLSTGTSDATGVVNWNGLPNTRAGYGPGGDFVRVDDAIDNADSSIDFNGADNIIQNTGPQIGGPGDNGDDVDQVIIVYNDIFSDGNYAFAYLSPIILFTNEGNLYVYLTQTPDDGAGFPVGINFENGVGVVAHEMGHNFDWQHTPPSTGFDIYADEWSLMSGGGADGPPGTIAFNRDQAGWIPSGDINTVSDGTEETFTLDIISDPSPGANYLMGKIPFGTGEYYTIEARKDSTFDQTPQNQFGLMIYHFNPSGHTGSPEPSAPVNVVDTTGTGDFDNADLDLGQSYTANGITIEYLSDTSTSITVRVNNNFAGDDGLLIHGQKMIGDFNNDGYDDMAVGIPGKDIGGNTDAGAVSVIYGTSTRLNAANSQIWHLDIAGVKGNAKTGVGEGESFGSSIGVGDFNGDGYDDMAVGITGKDIGGNTDAGAVSVIYGTTTRLSAANSQIWHLDTAGVKGNAKTGVGEGEFFGNFIGVGDFNGDGYDDLAVSIPGKDIGGNTDAGAVSVIYGTASRLSATNSQIWHLDIAGVTGKTKTGVGEGESFGNSIGVGDFNGDGYDDLAVGVTGKDIGGDTDAGAVSVIYGSASRLNAANSQIWHLDTAGVTGNAKTGVGEGEFFGSSMGVSDFNNDGYDDMAVGIPGKDISGNTDAGAVSVIYGTTTRLNAANSQIWHLDIAGVTGKTKTGVGEGEFFGSSIGVGDFNGNGYNDMAVGITGKDIGGDTDAGAVSVIYGSASRLSATNSQIWHLDTVGVKGNAKTGVGEGEFFGTSIGVGNFNVGSNNDLVVGIPGKDIGGNTDAGAVSVIYGKTSGLNAANSQIWHLDIAGVTGKTKTGVGESEFFGD